MKFRLPRFALAATVALFCTGAALAHGSSHAGQKPAERAPEQTPWGIAGEARSARTVQVRMTDDMRFRPGRIEVRQGETIRLVVRNDGRMLHEMVIGTKQALDEHAALMAKFPGMEHDEAFMAHVDPGQEAQIVWNFNRAGEFRFACLVPGHYQAGMVGTITVKPARKTDSYAAASDAAGTHAMNKR